MPMLDLTNQIFDRLTVLSRVEKPKGLKDTHAYWICRCTCGKETIASGKNLRRRLTRSCGCLKAETGRRNIKKLWGHNRTHGRTRTPIYNIWRGMLQRCYNPHSTGYRLYGGRGIIICEQWQHSFSNFLHDMGERPPPHPIEGSYSIERKDVNGNYTPANCIWATMHGQANNTRRNRFLTFQGQTKSLTQWAHLRGMTPFCLHGRLEIGWSLADALTRPVWKGGPRYFHHSLRRNHMITFKDQTKTLTEWARTVGLPPRCLHSRLKMGWSIAEALLCPLSKNRQPHLPLPASDCDISPPSA